MSFQKFEMQDVKGKVLFEADLKKYTRLRLGGRADVLFFPKDVEDLRCFLQKKADNTKYFILGGGSNLLIRDGGIRGVVIKLNAPYFKKIVCKEDALTCLAGVSNFALKNVLIKNGLGGLEFLCSIPGTTGGLVKTNAGCFGSCLSDVLIKALVMDKKGNVREVSKEEFHFSYRSSDFPSDWIVLALTLQTQKDTPEHIAEVIQTQFAYRKEHQPVTLRTAGSTFKNPKDNAAWKLIKDAGCADFCINGAKLSQKHCNFMEIAGACTAADVEALGEKIIQTVQKKTGIRLDWEVERVGEAL